MKTSLLLLLISSEKINAAESNHVAVCEVKTEPDVTIAEKQEGIDPFDAKIRYPRYLPSHGRGH